VSWLVGKLSLSKGQYRADTAQIAKVNTNGSTSAIFYVYLDLKVCQKYVLKKCQNCFLFFLGSKYSYMFSTKKRTMDNDLNINDDIQKLVR
jgi:hypothetical protein